MVFDRRLCSRPQLDTLGSGALALTTKSDGLRPPLMASLHPLDPVLLNGVRTLAVADARPWSYLPVGEEPIPQSLAHESSSDRDQGASTQWTGT